MQPKLPVVSQGTHVAPAPEPEQTGPASPTSPQPVSAAPLSESTHGTHAPTRQAPPGQFASPKHATHTGVAGLSSQNGVFMEQPESALATLSSTQGTHALLLHTPDAQSESTVHSTQVGAMPLASQAGAPIVSQPWSAMPSPSSVQFTHTGVPMGLQAGAAPAQPLSRPMVSVSSQARQMP